MAKDVLREFRLFTDHLDAKAFRALSAGIGLGVAYHPKESAESKVMDLVPIGEPLLPILPPVAKSPLKIYPRREAIPPRKPPMAPRPVARNIAVRKRHPLRILPFLVATCIDLMVVTLTLGMSFVCAMLAFKGSLHRAAVVDFVHLVQSTFASRPFRVAALCAFFGIFAVYSLLFHVAIGNTIGGVVSRYRRDS